MQTVVNNTFQQSNSSKVLPGPPLQLPLAIELRVRTRFRFFFLNVLS